MKLESVVKSHHPNKRLMATFCLCPNNGGGCKKPQKKEVHFGQDGANTYVDHATDDERSNYIARHQVNENWTDATSPGALSRYILWGSSRSIQENIKSFKSKFNV